MGNSNENFFSLDPNNQYNPLPLFSKYTELGFKVIPGPPALWSYLNETLHSHLKSGKYDLEDGIDQKVEVIGGECEPKDDDKDSTMF